MTGPRLTMQWVGSLARRRAGHESLVILGVALSVGLLASLGCFLAATKASMTQRAVATVDVDWQVQLADSANQSAAVPIITSSPHVQATETVEFGTTTGFSNNDGTTTHTTGSGEVVGVSGSYRQTFPGAFRDLAGASAGVLLYQQTAANLGARVGSTITIQRPGLPDAPVKVDGIIDIPQADSLFQVVGAPAGAQLQAPPDNVVVLPSAAWHELFDPLATPRPDLAHTQIHVRTDRQLPSDPAAAYGRELGLAQHLELALNGDGTVGNNLAATLASARTDALYAQMLFLFLAAPGAVLAAVITAALAGAGAEKRRREFGLLRARGATTRRLVALGAAEATMVGLIGGIAGIAFALGLGRWAFGTSSFGAGRTVAALWLAAAIALGFVVAIASIAIPAARDARTTTVASAQRPIHRSQRPRWMAWKLDLILLVAGIGVFWLTSRSGYNVVLAVEGVPSISVDYWAFLGPALLWIAMGLLAARIMIGVLNRGRGVLAATFRPLSGALSDTVAASLQRQRRLIARSTVLVALTLGFALTTATFNATYRQQTAVDAVLTNGADVTVTVAPGAPPETVGALTKAIDSTPGIRHVEPLQHRFAYVGNDLQDIYGVRPSTIVDAGKLQDAYFKGGSARQLIDKLASQPDAILVSDETVHDFQLVPGDLLNLRLQDGVTQQYVTVPFHYVGIAREFPTAPRDSFLIANADYVGRMTAAASANSFLIDTGGRNIAAVADNLRQKAGTTATVTDVVSSLRIVGSTLTAADLRGLTRVELGFALALACAATGLNLWLGLNERRRTFTIVSALGGNERQLGAFVWTEAVVSVVMGLILGLLGAWVLTTMTVKILTGVFDPPPTHLAVPWAYIAVVLGLIVGSAAAAAFAVTRTTRRADMELLRTV